MPCFESFNFRPRTCIPAFTAVQWRSAERIRLCPICRRGARTGNRYDDTTPNGPARIVAYADTVSVVVHTRIARGQRRATLPASDESR
jgi:hypothetical protein